MYCAQEHLRCLLQSMVREILKPDCDYESSSDRKRVLSQSKEQYEKECGMKWEQYHSTALESRQLKPLLESARNEDPLSDPTSLQESTRQS
ncbi:hypothetical protein PSTT_02714 [Puccinia striiformis]|uniref:Uncharacterized protein n=1 Tax=Puccinia striiformis TaxID=27350 RepID=A0A2S4VZ69_9BASI|nr:hypothetical protein PSTT_02714 [Puccinia striiformis]